MRKNTLFRCAPVTIACALSCFSAHAQPAVVKLQKLGDKFQLTRNGAPFFIKGAGGDASRQMLKDAGGNSFRTWGSDNLEGQLAQAQKLGLSVTIGIWLGHKEQGFKYDDPAAVAGQLEMAKKAILRYKDNPAVLAWGIGNEMEGYDQGDDPLIWNAVQDIAAFAHKNDSNHPTMTVIAEIGGKKIESINKYCPDIDIIGINSYGGGPSLAARYKAGGGVKPYAITEYGPPGTWEQKKNDWGIVPEPTSTQKANSYRATYESSIANQPLCVGSYAFAWGNKQEATATWYGMMLPDGTRLAAVDTMTDLWSGKPPANRVPEIKELKLAGDDHVAPEATVHATLNTVDPENDPLKVKWVLQFDPATYSVNGDTEGVPPTYPEAIVASSNTEVTLKMPKYKGGYRLFAYVTDTHNGGAVGNIPLDVAAGDDAPPPAAQKANLPMTLVGDAADDGFIPSGYMGNYAAIKMDPNNMDNPHSGKTDLKVDYTANDNWGGVVWQSPANDWGNQAGGFDLTGATAITFWARGANGCESVNFSYGLIGRDKKFYDTSTGGIDKVVLTKEWKQYSIDLAGKDLSRIKSGFAWVTAANGAPVSFYLDDVQYQRVGEGGVVARPKAAKADLPFAVYDEAGGAMPYIPAGYMGNAGAIKMDDKFADNPHAGKTSLKVQYTANDNWGGVVWQSPVNDWGNKEGGYDLTGAKKLTFWARGDKGGETVNFSFGLINRDKPYYDSGTGKLEKVALTADWKQYSIDLKDLDLSRIKTGFCWVVAGSGQPITFYLDDIKYE